MAGCIDEKSRFPSRGERVAAWVEGFLKREGVSLCELAFKASVDKRDLQRLLRDRSVGHRLEDDLAAFFGQTFVDAVMAPVVGVHITLLERQLEQRLAEAARLHEQVEREKRHGPGSAPGAALLRLVAGTTGASPAPLGRGA